MLCYQRQKRVARVPYMYALYACIIISLNTENLVALGQGLDQRPQDVYHLWRHRACPREHKFVCEGVRVRICVRGRQRKDVGYGEKTDRQ